MQALPPANFNLGQALSLWSIRDSLRPNGSNLEWQQSGTGNATLPYLGLPYLGQAQYPRAIQDRRIPQCQHCKRDTRSGTQSGTGIGRRALMHCSRRSLLVY